MNKDIMKSFGFTEEVAAVERGDCPFCHKHINPDTEFRDSLSRQEFNISGLCQNCQDQSFVAKRKRKG